MPEAKTTAAQAKGMTLAQKLMAIQKAIKTFENTEGSDKKKPGTNQSEYKYTPGWMIIDTIREQMNEYGLMLIQSTTVKENREITSNVYKLINSVPQSFEKKEILTTVSTAFTWLDTETGEQLGPIVKEGTGANGTDKSCASAISLAKRYFLLDSFLISTKDKDEDPDAHDSDNLPGLRNGEQPVTAPVSTVARGTAPQYAPAYQGPQQAPAPQYPMQPQQPAMQPSVQQNPYAAPPTYQQPAQQPQNPNEIFYSPELLKAAQALAHFARGTQSHDERLREVLGGLKGKVNMSIPNFIDNLVESGEAIRQQRMPSFR